MNKIILRFYIVKDNKYFETVFDERLSFKDNFQILKEIYDYPLWVYIFDMDKNISLKTDVPIKEFNFNNFMTLYLL